MVKRASLTINVIANYVGQFYVAAVNLAFLPLQVALLGAESYGLVGFFAAVSAWLQLLDIGLSPTLARETSSYRAGAMTAPAYRQLLRSIELVFFCLGTLVALVMWGLSRVIAGRWLRAEALSASSVASAIGLMGIVFALRWQATLSRSALLGMERQVLVNVVTAAAATARSAGVIMALRVIAATPATFFCYQAAVALVELLVLRASLTRILAFSPELPPARWTIAPLKKVAPFSMRVAVTGFIWICVTQIDKLLLSRFVPLAEYGHFSIAVTAASAVTLLAGPIGQAIQPRLTYFFAESNEQGLRRTYSDATQVLSGTALAASFVIAAVAKALLWVWTGNAALADSAGRVLGFYALGNGLLALVAMTYYLQVAHGDLRLHVRGMIAFAALLVPGIVWATLRRGMLGAAQAWFAANVLYLVAWTPIVHRRLMPGRHLVWLTRDALLPGLLALPVALTLARINLLGMSRLSAAFAMAGAGAVAVVAASFAVLPLRRVLRALATRRRDA